MDLQELVDRRQIDDVLYTYAQALDAQDWDRLRTSVFTANAVADFLDYGVIKGVDTIVTLISGVLTGLDATQHIIGTPLARVDRDRATASCYLHAQHIFRGLADGDSFIVAGTYTDELVRVDDGWRITTRALKAAWTTGNPGVFTAAAERLANS